MKLSSGICCCRGAVLTGLTCQFSKNPEEDEQTKERVVCVCVWSWGGGGRLQDYNDYSCFCGRTKKTKKKKTTGCYTRLAFMKKDFDVNDCESPPHHPSIQPPTTRKKSQKKIETSTELSKWQIQNILPYHPFFNERRNRGGVKGRKEGVFCSSIRKKSIKCI